MTTINRLALLDTPSTADQIPVYSSSNGDARRMPINALLGLFQSTFSSPTLAVQVYTPGTGFNIAAPTPSSTQQWLCIQPAGTLATGTVTMPLNTTTPDGTEILVTTTQQITAFTVGANGAAQVFGAPTTLAANAFFRLRFIAAQNSWYRIS
jgi:hypothetical protein